MNIKEATIPLDGEVPIIDGYRYMRMVCVVNDAPNQDMSLKMQYFNDETEKNFDNCIERASGWLKRWK